MQSSQYGQTPSRRTKLFHIEIHNIQSEEKENVTDCLPEFHTTIYNITSHDIKQHSTPYYCTLTMPDILSGQKTDVTEYLAKLHTTIQYITIHHIMLCYKKKTTHVTSLPTNHLDLQLGKEADVEGHAKLSTTMSYITLCYINIHYTVTQQRISHYYTQCHV